MLESELGVMEIDPDALKFARERVSLTRDELASRMDGYIRGYRGIQVLPETVAEWESGARGMTSVETWAATEVCMFPFYALFEKDPPPEAFADFRSPPNGTREPVDYNTHRQLHRFERLYEMVFDLSARLGAIEETTVPTALSEEAENVIARRMRRSLGVTNDIQAGWTDEEEALIAWKALTSDLGVFVFSLPLNVQQIRGASRWDSGGPPAVLISTSDLASARSFTLMHELAHLMHRHAENPMCDPSRKSQRSEESRMNRIAAEVLVPEGWVRNETEGHSFSSVFKEWPTNERIRLTKTFGVSSQMMGIRLKQLGIVLDDGYRTSEWGSGVFYSRKGQKRTRAPRKHERYRTYLGTRATNLLKRALDQDQISLGEVVKHYVDTKTETVELIVAD